MARYRIGIPQLMWVYVEVEVNGTDPGDSEFELDEEELREKAIEKAYAIAPRHICASYTGWGRSDFLLEVDELGSLVDTSKLTLELDIIKREDD